MIFIVLKEKVKGVQTVFFGCFNSGN